MISWEYHGFFEIGMVHRNERNAIIQHGTMTIIRRRMLTASGNWAEWCICEDAELGLRIQSRGWDTVYIRQSFGKGLTPDSFAGYKRQRFRWVYGAVQIMKRHWPELSPFSRRSGLTLAQRYHFIAGWLPWFGDAISFVMNLLCILWAVGMFLSPKHFGSPLYMLMLPPIGAFLFKLLHFLWLYSARVPCTLRQRLGAALAGTALTHTIAAGIISGLFTSSKPFLRTPKCEGRSALVQGLMQALPYAAALLLSLFSVMPAGPRPADASQPAAPPQSAGSTQAPLRLLAP
jgi:hypothetical protein